jgi:hypothetical protein
MPVIQDSHAPMLWVNEYTTIIATQTDAATQDTTLRTESALLNKWRTCSGPPLLLFSTLLWVVLEIQITLENPAAKSPPAKPKG